MFYGGGDEVLLGLIAIISGDINLGGMRVTYTHLYPHTPPPIK